MNKEAGLIGMIMTLISFFFLMGIVVLFVVYIYIGSQEAEEYELKCIQEGYVGYIEDVRPSDFIGCVDSNGNVKYVKRDDE